ncbi:MAG: CPBP family intramembrane glutamic endopeptidase [Parvularculaceae bacterium]
MSFFNDLWKGHVFAFERPLERLPNTPAIARFVLAFVLCGVALLWIGRQALDQSYLADQRIERLALVAALMALSLVIAQTCVGKHWGHLGLRPISEWTRREVLYAAQVLPIASIVFFLIFRPLIDQLIDRNGAIGFLAFNLLYGLIWGFYQEFAYRGLLQNALSSWMGPVAGVLLANLVFTFGPLHASLYAGAMEDPSQALVFLPIFAVGLLFGIVYQRSGNLWLPAIFHGLWPLNMAS